MQDWETDVENRATQRFQVPAHEAEMMTAGADRVEGLEVLVAV